LRDQAACSAAMRCCGEGGPRAVQRPPALHPL
jgi:hypothetical protein